MLKFTSRMWFGAFGFSIVILALNTKLVIFQPFKQYVHSLLRLDKVLTWVMLRFTFGISFEGFCSFIIVLFSTL